MALLIWKPSIALLDVKGGGGLQDRHLGGPMITWTVKRNFHCKQSDIVDRKFAVKSTFWHPPIDCTPTGAGIPNLPEHLMKYNEYGVLALRPLWARSVGDAIRSLGWPLHVLILLPGWQWTHCRGRSVAQSRRWQREAWVAPRNPTNGSVRPGSFPHLTDDDVSPGPLLSILQMAVWGLAHSRTSQMMMWALGRSARYFRYLTDNKRTVTSTWCSTCARPGKQWLSQRRMGCLRLLTTLYGKMNEDNESKRLQKEAYPTLSPQYLTEGWTLKFTSQLKRPGLLHCQAEAAKEGQITLHYLFTAPDYIDCTSWSETRDQMHCTNYG
jgi:hypothetical protein